MVAYNFQKQFADSVEDHSKLQTIRAERKDGRHAKKGDELQLYTGMRTKACRLLRKATCEHSGKIIIREKCVELEHMDGQLGFISQIDLDAFAVRDGFKNWQDLINWFEKTHYLPFTGRIISWT